MNIENLKNTFESAIQEIITEKRAITSFVAPKHNKMIMLMKRTKDEKWGLPGGRIEKKERVKQAARRETAEETNMEFNKLNKVAKIRGKNKNIHLFTTKAMSQLPNFRMNKEHTDYGYFKINELKDFMKKKIDKIAVRNADGLEVEYLKRKKFKLHKPAKLFIRNS